MITEKDRHITSWVEHTTFRATTINQPSDSQQLQPNSEGVWLVWREDADPYEHGYYVSIHETEDEANAARDSLNEKEIEGTKEWAEEADYERFLSCHYCVEFKAFGERL